MKKLARPKGARQRALQVLQELGITAAPIAPEQIASARKVAVQTRSDFPPDVYGALARHGNRFTILVSRACPTEGHRRFTICHELGHYHLEGHVEALFSSADVAFSRGGNYRGKDPYEVEADAFASELLMPEALARPVVERLVPGIEAVRTIAEQFGVSLSAAAIRLAMLSTEPCAAILCHNRTVEWVSFSQAFDGHSWTPRHRRGDWAPRGSGTYALARDPDRVLAGDEESGSVLLCEWFEGAPTVEATDECVGLGPYARVLTILSCPDLPPAEDETEDW